MLCCLRLGRERGHRHRCWLAGGVRTQGARAGDGVQRSLLVCGDRLWAGSGSAGDAAAGDSVLVFFLGAALALGAALRLGAISTPACGSARPDFPNLYFLSRSWNSYGSPEAPQPCPLVTNEQPLWLPRRSQPRRPLTETAPTLATRTICDSL